MSREELIKQITPIAQSIFQKQDLVISDELSGQNLETWTSLAFMKFISAIEEQYGFRFRLVELFPLRNMGAIIDATLVHIQ